MALQFNANIFPQEQQQQYPSFREAVLDPIQGGINAIIQNKQLEIQQKRQQMMDQYLQAKEQRDQMQFNSEYGTPIDPNQMSVAPEGPSMFAKSSMMPGGQGQVAQPSPLIQQFNDWRAKGMPKQGAQGDFMNALGRDERKSFQDQFKPQPQYVIPNLNETGGVTGFTPLPEGTKPAGGMAKPPAPNTPTTNQDRGTESNLRAQFLTQSKDFNDTATSFQRIQDSANNPSAAGDLSLIFNYMKMLDPGSTVREGEFATAQNAGSIPQSILGQYNKAVNGERLAPELRADFLNRATQLYQGQKSRHDQRIAEFTRIAQNSGVNPQNIIMDLSTPIQSSQSKPITAKNPSTGQRIQSLDGGQTWQPVP